MASDPNKRWYITGKGRVTRFDKVRGTESIPDSFPNPEKVDAPFYDKEDATVENGFYSKEEAEDFRDQLIDAYPSYFLFDSAPNLFPDAAPEEDPDEPVQLDKGDKKKERNRRNFSQEEFQRLTRQKAFEYYNVFWTAFTKLKPKDQCDVYMKMIKFGFAQAPTLKPLDEEDLQKQKDKKQSEVEDAIRSGIATDTNFEEEDD